MKKRILSILFVIILAVSILPTYASAAGTLSNFMKIRTYAEGQFSDVSNQWFASDVKTAFEYNLIDGSTPTTFSPSANLTIAAAIKLAACVNSMYNTGTISFPSGASPWYQPYVDYALANGIIQSPYSNYAAYATRSDMAVIFANALPDEAMTPINTVNDNAIPDVSVSFTYGAAVYKLYKAGILSGSGDTHAYKPNDNITRGEVAAIVARLASSSNRVSFSMSSKELTSTEIAAKCSPAVFYMELYDSTGTAFASGSGFFISSSGLAVTNFHVIDGASSAKILTTDGKVYNVSGVYDYKEEYDLALIQIDGANFPYLELGDSSTVVTGATVFAIGSPKGLDNTFSQGIVSNASRKFSDSVVNFIQIDAAISHGSSGGALINTKGQAIGVTAAGRDDAQNINFAVPVNLIKELSKTTTVPLSTIAAQSSNLTLTATPSTVSISKGAQASVTFTANSYDFADSYYTVGDESIISCTWGEWGDNLTIPLTITGLSVGTTTVLLELVDKNDKTIVSTTVYVTVTAGATTATYYQGYYPVPDWGAFTGTPLYRKSVIPEGSTYFYKMSDVRVGTDVALDQYYASLEQNGFSYYTDYYDDQGYVVIVYTNHVWNVYVGLMNLNGTVCMAISVFAV